MSSVCTSSPLIVALDFDNQRQALSLVDKLDPATCRLKIGKELFTRLGPEIVHAVQSRGFDVFLDLKFHDIPNTTSKAVLAAADLGVWMVNVHACGGLRMLETSKRGLEQAGHSTLLIAVTVLTSFDEQMLNASGIEGSVARQVERLVQLAQAGGLDGVVASAQEAPAIKRQTNHSKTFKVVTPGIRPTWANADDQKRVLTPEAALAAGSDYLVVGRPITQAENPSTACQKILESINEQF